MGLLNLRSFSLIFSETQSMGGPSMNVDDVRKEDLGVELFLNTCWYMALQCLRSFGKGHSLCLVVLQLRSCQL